MPKRPECIGYINISIGITCMRSELLDNRAERQCREEGEATDENHGAHKKRDELHPSKRDFRVIAIIFDFVA